jgi:hypothetical protein
MMQVIRFLVGLLDPNQVLCRLGRMTELAQTDDIYVPLSRLPHEVACVKAILQSKPMSVIWSTNANNGCDLSGEKWLW